MVPINKHTVQRELTIAEYNSDHRDHYCTGNRIAVIRFHILPLALRHRYRHPFKVKWLERQDSRENNSEVYSPIVSSAVENKGSQTKR